jgi:hypothetical protein
MRLNPKRLVGRPNRKALAFESEIARLRLEGYSCEAIWDALLDAGLALSLSSVKREVARLAHRAAATAKSIAANPMTQPPAFAATSSPAPASPAKPSLPGKEVAAAWMKDRITNPLLRARIAHESSRH